MEHETTKPQNNDTASKAFHKITGILIPVVIASTGFVSLSVLARRLNSGLIPVWTVSKHYDVNLTFTMQVIMLLLSFVALVIMYIYNRKSFKDFFRMGVNRENDWAFTGPLVAAGFTAGTVMLMSFSVTSQNGLINATFFQLLPWVFLFAATNAWSEELFSRFVIVAGLHGKLRPVIICGISAAVFGVPHFFGTPSGLFGVFAAGFLGWLLAKSVIETKGIGWALIIHFFQDVAIFGAGAMILAGK